jgi:hypothetical protein
MASRRSASCSTADEAEVMDVFFDDICVVNITTLISHQLGELTHQLVVGTPTVKTNSTIAQICERLQSAKVCRKKNKDLGHHLASCPRTRVTRP